MSGVQIQDLPVLLEGHVELLHKMLLSHVFCLLGQDIKSDGFSIETCKIMVDMLDVSFNRP